MICQDLQPRADDKSHEEEIEKMSESQPRRESGTHRMGGSGLSGVARDERLDRRQVA
jgi:hypothetical protein